MLIVAASVPAGQVVTNQLRKCCPLLLLGPAKSVIWLYWWLLVPCIFLIVLHLLTLLLFLPQLLSCYSSLNHLTSVCFLLCLSCMDLIYILSQSSAVIFFLKTELRSCSCATPRLDIAGIWTSRPWVTSANNTHIWKTNCLQMEKRKARNLIENGLAIGFFKPTDNIL